MKAVIQRVLSAQVHVDGALVSSVQRGLLTLLAIENGDNEEHLQKLIDKIVHLRVFEDEAGKMNHSLKDLGLEHLIVSQFTLAADCTKGRRPAFTNAAPPALAKELYEKSLKYSQNLGISTKSGQFQADMKITLVNDGPATFIL